MRLDAVATYTKYKKSTFFVQAYNLCPNLHRGDDYCGLCEALVNALEKAYQDGMNYGLVLYFKQQEKNNG